MAIMLPASSIDAIRRASSDMKRAARVGNWLRELGVALPALALIPGAVALGHELSKPTIFERAVGRARRRRLRDGLTFGATVAAGLAVVRWQLARKFVARPPMTVEARVGPLELRRYAPEVHASTSVTTRDGVAEAVARLRAYARGANVDRALWRQSTHERDRRSERVALLLPYRVTAAHGAAHAAETQVEVSLSASSVAELPLPTDGRVHLKKYPARSVAVLRFSGLPTAARVAERGERLKALVVQHGLRAKGDVSLAVYDRTTTIPWLRCNEVWLELV